MHSALLKKLKKVEEQHIWQLARLECAKWVQTSSNNFRASNNFRSFSRSLGQTKIKLFEHIFGIKNKSTIALKIWISCKIVLNFNLYLKKSRGQ